VAAPSDDTSDFLWLRPQHPLRSPQPSLSREQIAAVAVTIADRDGVEALSMRRVAAELGCGTMSLYRHVRTKDELLDLMIDAVAGEDGDPPTPSGGWRVDLHDVARRWRAAALRHPWIPRVSAGRPSVGPRTLATVEFALSAVDGLGLSIDEMAGMVQTVQAFVRGFVQNELAEREWRTRPTGPSLDPWRTGMIAYVQHLVETGKFPQVVRLIMETEDFPDPDTTFEWQLQCVLDGLAAAIRQQPRRRQLPRTPRA
jgi:AcrR family transcriptional regulator